MNYAVAWWPLAESQLAVLWKSAPDPEVVADAADAVNRLLAAGPSGLGESRGSPARRLWFHRPMCVLYVIDEPNHVVFVAAVAWVGD